MTSTFTKDVELSKCGAEIHRLAAALGAESARVTDLKLALRVILDLKPDFTSPEVFYHAVRDTAAKALLPTKP